MGLSNEIILNGIFSLLTVVVCVIVGLMIISKYRIKKEKKVILVGIAWIGISEPWWPSTIGFIVALFNQTGITEELYLFLNSGFLPLFLLIWLVGLKEPLMINKWKVLIIIHILISIILEISLIYFLYNNVDIVGNLLSPVDVDFEPLTIILLLYILSIFIVTGFLFAYRSLKLDDPKIKLRGKFLLLAFILFLIGSIMEVIFTTPINRIILLLSAIVFYFGYIMPNKIKSFFLKN